MLYFSCAVQLLFSPRYLNNSEISIYEIKYEYTKCNTSIILPQKDKMSDFFPLKICKNQHFSRKHSYIRRMEFFL